MSPSQSFFTPANAGVRRKRLKYLDSRFRGNDEKGIGEASRRYLAQSHPETHRGAGKG